MRSIFVYVQPLGKVTLTVSVALKEKTKIMPTYHPEIKEKIQLDMFSFISVKLPYLLVFSVFAE